MVEQACKNCHFITSANICPNCKKSSLSSDWTGEIIIVDIEKSQIAKKVGITKPGRYALRVR